MSGLLVSSSSSVLFLEHIKALSKADQSAALQTIIYNEEKISKQIKIIQRPIQQQKQIKPFKSTHYYMLRAIEKRCVLRYDLNSDKVEAIIMCLWTGKLFQRVGPATSKTLDPLVFRRVLGVWRRSLPSDLSPLARVDWSKSDK